MVALSNSTLSLEGIHGGTVHDQGVLGGSSTCHDSLDEPSRKVKSKHHIFQKIPIQRIIHFLQIYFEEEARSTVFPTVVLHHILA